MYIEIETTDTFKDQLTSKNNGKVYFTLEQPALMFTEGSRYPHQFKVRLAFTENAQERDSVGSIAKGRYQLSDEAFRISRFGGLELGDVNIKTLRPMVSPSAIPQTKVA